MGLASHRRDAEHAEICGGTMKVSPRLLCVLCGSAVCEPVSGNGCKKDVVV